MNESETVGYAADKGVEDFYNDRVWEPPFRPEWTELHDAYVDAWFFALCQDVLFDEFPNG